MNTKPEPQRLSEVYRHYAETGRSQTHWDERNSGNAAVVHERQRVMRQILSQGGFECLNGVRLLEIGCGSGKVLADFRDWGTREEDLVGVDLVPERIAEAQQRIPGARFMTTNAEQFPFPDDSFDLVLLSTVFTSILDNDMAHAVARSADRVLRPEGAVVWYDFRFNNPWNANVRGVSRRRIAELFPGYRLRLRTITLLPPLARRLGPLTDALYPILAAVPWLRTHYVGLLRKPV